MDFGLLPEFSTPVQKPVENACVLNKGAKRSLVLQDFSKAKVWKSRFEAILGVDGEISPSSVGL
jgi:hypothetical protein